ncbi:hypothetical protein DL96DRAFT_1250646 [Flagelloscypha sp. PMI_526]|nr:hypothetical protein DL96DRAFT_1250646 [Flagelloscypha sp. PMI_526]
MKFHLSPLFFILASSIPVFAQFNDLPDCSLPCVKNAVQSTGCASTDLVCICTFPNFLDGVATCVQSACSTEDQVITIVITRATCTAALGG